MDTIYSDLDLLLGISATRPEQLSVLQVCVRSFVVYAVLIAYVRFGKKRFLGEATAFDAILLILIGSLASRAISGTAPFFASLGATFILILTHWVVSYLCENAPVLSNLVKGHDTLLIKNGHVDRGALRQAHMAYDDLAEDLRQEGVQDPRDVKEARLERSGRVSVIRKR